MGRKVGAGLTLLGILPKAKADGTTTNPPAGHKVIALTVQTELTNKFRIQGSFGVHESLLLAQPSYLSQAKLVPTHS